MSPGPSATPRLGSPCAATRRSRRVSPRRRARISFDRYLSPRPRLDLVPFLRAQATAAMDVSDGLAGDLAKLCKASGVSAVVEAAHVPLSAAAKEAIALEPGLLTRALTGGDDYEILFSASTLPQPPDGVVRIGSITEGATAPVFRAADGTPIVFDRPSFSHF
jgi:thiamine-monophosphate kinase